MIVIEQSQNCAEFEGLLKDIMGQCAWLTLRIRKLTKVENFDHTVVEDIEQHLLSAGRVACAIDSRLFAAPTCIGNTVH